MTDTLIRTHYTISAAGWTLELGPKTLIMGILNVTPDSFSDGGRYRDPDRAVARAWQMVDEGADIVDVGGESTRPGSEQVDADQELERVRPVLDALSRNRFPLPISIDTSKYEVARAALERGAAIVNDVTSLRSDPRLGPLVASCDAALILMHMRGEPRTMHLIPRSPDVRADLSAWAHEAVAAAEKSGVSSRKIILDPGIGFGKSARQNLEIIRHLQELASAGRPVLVGPSRKSFIGTILKDVDPDRIWGTSASVAASVIFGAHIVRVHDVAAMRAVARMTDAVMNEGAEA
jgi:dihydropteroate synthase